MAAEWRALRAANVLPGGARVEVVESYFLLASVRHLLGWLAELTRHGRKPSKELVVAAKQFRAVAPKPTVLRDLLERRYTMRGWDLPELDMQSPATALALIAARGREYRMPGGVSLPATLAALRALSPVLAKTRAALAAAAAGPTP